MAVMHGRHAVDRPPHERGDLAVPGGDSAAVRRVARQFARDVHASIGREYRREAVPVLRIHATEVARLQLLDLLDRLETLNAVHNESSVLGRVEPRHAIHGGGLGKALELNGPAILEAELLADAELPHR